MSTLSYDFHLPFSAVFNPVRRESPRQPAGLCAERRRARNKQPIGAALTTDSYLWWVLLAGVVGILYGVLQTGTLMKASAGSERDERSVAERT